MHIIGLKITMVDNQQSKRHMARHDNGNVINLEHAMESEYANF